MAFRRTKLYPLFSPNKPFMDGRIGKLERWDGTLMVHYSIAMYTRKVSAGVVADRRSLSLAYQFEERASGSGLAAAGGAPAIFTFVTASVGDHGHAAIGAIGRVFQSGSRTQMDGGFRRAGRRGRNRRCADSGTR